MQPASANGIPKNGVESTPPRGHKRARPPSLNRVVANDQKRLVKTVADYILHRTDICFPSSDENAKKWVFSGNSALLEVHRNIGLRRNFELNQQVIASVWVPSYAMRYNAVFTGDLHNLAAGDVYRVMVRMVTYLADVLVENEACSSSDLYYSIAFWRHRSPTSGSSSMAEAATLSKKETSDIYANMYQGMTVSLCTRECSGQPDKEDVQDALMMLSTDIELTPFADSEHKRRRTKKKTVVRAVGDEGEEEEVNATSIADVIESAGKTNISSIVHKYLGSFSDSTRHAIYSEGCARWISTTTTSKFCSLSAQDRESNPCIGLMLKLQKRAYDDHLIWKIVLPNISTAISDFVVCSTRILSESSAKWSEEMTFSIKKAARSVNTTHRKSMVQRRAIGESNSSGVQTRVNEHSKKTNERKLQHLHKHFQQYIGELAGTYGSAVKDPLESTVRRLMFNLHCAMARGPDESISIVGEALHNARLEDEIDKLSYFALQRYGVDATEAHFLYRKLRTGNPYDVYRCMMLYDISGSLGCRPENCALAQLLVENVAAAYDTSNPLKSNVVLYGDPGTGKDFILENVVQSLHVPGTVVKESRATTCADSVESSGRHDDQVVFNPELNVRPFMKCRSRGGGDTKIKDLRTSGKIVTRVYRNDKNTGKRTFERVVFERYILCYEATNPEIISRIDGALVERYLWIGMPPVTTETTKQLSDAKYQRRIKTSNKRDKTIRSAMVSCQRFLQLATFEVYKMSLCGCVRPISTEAALFMMSYISSLLTDKEAAFGCIPPIKRRQDQIMMIATGHAIRRSIVECFMTNGGRYYRRALTPLRLASIPYYVSMADLSLALGQVGDYVGIFEDGEVQVLMALRYIWVTSPDRYTMFVRDRRNKNGFRVSNPRYIRFPGTFKTIARECSSTLRLICAREYGSPREITFKMLVDTLYRLVYGSTSYRQPACVTVKDDCVKFTREYTEMQEDIDDCDEDEERKFVTRYDYYDTRKRTLVPCLSPDHGRIRSLDKNPVPVPAIVQGRAHIDMHVAYLNRLFDPDKKCWPWTERKPEKWSPVIDEHMLLAHCLEMIRSHDYQCSAPRLVYRMAYTEKPRGALPERASAGSSSSSTGVKETKYECSFNYVTKKVGSKPRGMLHIPHHFEGSEEAGDDGDVLSPTSSSTSCGKTSVPLCVPLDKVSLLATAIGWNRAVDAASSVEKWEAMRHKLPSYRAGRAATVHSDDEAAAMVDDDPD